MHLKVGRGDLAYSSWGYGLSWWGGRGSRSVGSWHRVAAIAKKQTVAKMWGYSRSLLVTHFL